MSRSSIPSAAPTNMKYQLDRPDDQNSGSTVIQSWRRLLPLMAEERRNIILAFFAILVTSGTALAAPALIGHTVDTYIRIKDYPGIILNSAVLAAVYVIGVIANYLQIKLMGGVGRRVLFNLRNAIFNQLQSLPVAFFNQNKAGDLISRINNDTDKLNQFFSQALMQFVNNVFLIAGAGLFLVVLNARLGLAALAPALAVLIITRAVSGWVKRKNVASLRSLGGMSAEIQESLENFKVIAAFNRLDYFRRKFQAANEDNFSASVSAGLASNIFTPLYALASSLAQLIVLAFGIYLIAQGSLTIGLLIGFLLYVNNFYFPLRQMASVWATFQLALASFERVSEVLALKSDMAVIPAEKDGAAAGILEFREVFFAYPEGREVLKDINFVLRPGQTYALIGPTGGGKTTIASLMARLYDPASGIVLLKGRDIRSYPPEERTRLIGFILQEPFLFTGTVRDNIIYGNDLYSENSDDELSAAINEYGLAGLLARFEKGLDTPVAASGGAISLGQKQLIAFMRAILRRPEILILDEATANIDTVTERLLAGMLDRLPPATTKVVIAHRLNTIESADEIFFINAGNLIPAGSLGQAVEMLMRGKRDS